MGIRGQRPKSIEKQIAEGDPRKHGKKKLQERLETVPKTSSGLVDCPQHLKGRARYAWQLWSDELAVMKLDKRPDSLALEGACRAYERAVNADLILDKSGLTIEDKYIAEDGEVIVLRIRKHPAVEISNRSWTIVRAFCGEFGFTPVSRQRLTIEKDADPDEDLAKLLGGARAPRSGHPGSPLTQ